MSITGTLSCATAPIAPPGYLAVSILLGELVVTEGWWSGKNSAKNSSWTRPSQVKPPTASHIPLNGWINDIVIKPIADEVLTCSGPGGLGQSAFFQSLPFSGLLNLNLMYNPDQFWCPREISNYNASVLGSRDTKRPKKFRRCDIKALFHSFMKMLKFSTQLKWATNQDSL
jgi:hypothetical protein